MIYLFNDNILYYLFLFFLLLYNVSIFSCMIFVASAKCLAKKLQTGFVSIYI